ncbi:LacI family DNA-binding transcriptional regulator, partial [Curtobacterium sp. B18]|uniref:LacI family DNA-binding transcriptional regulator n=1 Tax=Curtobacterium sp. B18 TaxID=95614 RepID=UPI0021C8F10F
MARVAGVSHQTVSRVLNNSDAVVAETRDKVLAAMEQLQYRPNRAARALVTSRTHTIGVLTAQRSHYGPAATMQAIEDAAVRRGYSVTTANIAAATDEAVRDGLGHLLDQDVEGIIVIAPQQLRADEVSEDRIIRGMVGRDLSNRYPERENPVIGEELLRIEDWTVHHPLDGPAR